MVPLAFGFSQRRQRVRRFAGLGDGQHDRVAIHGRIAIAKFRCVFDLDGNAGKFLKEIFADDGRMIAGAAGGEDETLGTA